MAKATKMNVNYRIPFLFIEVLLYAVILRGMSIPLAELPVVLQQIRAGATLGQNVPKSETEDKEDSE